MIVYIYTSNAEVQKSVFAIKSQVILLILMFAHLQVVKNRRESAKLKIISSIHKPRDTALPESWIKTQKARQISFIPGFEVTGDDCIISVREGACGCNRSLSNKNADHSAQSLCFQSEACQTASLSLVFLFML